MGMVSIDEVEKNIDLKGGGFGRSDDKLEANGTVLCCLKDDRNRDLGVPVRLRGVSD